MRVTGCLLIVLGVVGCNQTGLLLEVGGPNGTTSTAAGIATLDFVVAHRSWCERWVSDACCATGACCERATRDEPPTLAPAPSSVRCARPA